jgi:transposase-like protein
MVRRYVEDKQTMREIAHDLGCAYTTVNRILTAADIPKRSRGGDHTARKPPARQQAIVERYTRDAQSIHTIAQELGCADSTVHRALSLSGTPRRPRGGGTERSRALTEPPTRDHSQMYDKPPPSIPVISVRLTVRCEVDVQRWARLHGFGPPDAHRDLTRYVIEAVADGRIERAVRAALPGWREAGGTVQVTDPQVVADTTPPPAEPAASPSPPP